MSMSMENKEKSVPQIYINTPFAYTKLSRNLSLLQQTILNKVSEYLQEYVQYYYGSELKNSHDRPRPLFSEARKNSGLPKFLVPYAELGVGVDHFNAAREAVDEVLALKIEVPGVDQNGHPSFVKQLIFTKANMSYSENNGVLFSLNPSVVDWVFDMSQGYVRHPANIARIGKVERMPMMYYYLFKHSEKWKNREVNLTVQEIKDYLGLYKRVKEGSDNRAGRKKNKQSADAANEGIEVLEEAYPKFYHFKKNILEKSVQDINRLNRIGLLDVYVTYMCIYSNGRKTGNPDYIRFHIYDSYSDAEKQRIKALWQTLPYMNCQGNKRREFLAGAWLQFLSEYDGEGKVQLERMIPSYIKDNMLILDAKDDDAKSFDALLMKMKKEEKRRLVSMWGVAFNAPVKEMEYRLLM